MANKTCPNCGAELHNVQGYNFVCMYCGTITPVDPHTRAMIDEQRNAQMRQQAIVENQKMEKNLKKGCLIALVVIVTIIAALITALIVFNKCQRDKWHEENEKIRQEQLQKAQEQRGTDYTKNSPQKQANINVNDFYFSPSTIFSNTGKDGIGHLNQNIRSTLMAKGFKEEGSELFSYYDTDNNPIITVKLNSYYPPSHTNTERMNENDDIHSIRINISDKDAFNEFQSTFCKELRSLGFEADRNDTYNFKGSSAMIGFKYIRLGNHISQTDGYSTNNLVNWEGVKIEDYNSQIECVAFQEF